MSSSEARQQRIDEVHKHVSEISWGYRQHRSARYANSAAEALSDHHEPVCPVRASDLVNLCLYRSCTASPVHAVHLMLILCAVAILTVRILAMAEHMKAHRKDFSSRL